MAARQSRGTNRRDVQTTAPSPLSLSSALLYGRPSMNIISMHQASRLGDAPPDLLDQLSTIQFPLGIRVANLSPRLLQLGGRRRQLGVHRLCLLLQIGGKVLSVRFTTRLTARRRTGQRLVGTMQVAVSSSSSSRRSPLPTHALSQTCRELCWLCAAWALASSAAIRRAASASAAACRRSSSCCRLSSAALRLARLSRPPLRSPCRSLLSSRRSFEARSALQVEGGRWGAPGSL